MYTPYYSIPPGGADRRYLRSDIAKLAPIVVDILPPGIYHGIMRNKSGICGKEVRKMPGELDVYSERQKMKRPDFELQYKRDSYLKKVKLHHHDFYEIFFLISGDVTYTIESKLYKVIPGDILLISPRELHQLHIWPEREVYERYVLWVDPRTIQRLSTCRTDLTSCLDPTSPGYRNQLRLSPEDQRHIYGLVGRLHEELTGGGFGGELMPECLLVQLLVEINRIARRTAAMEEEVTRGGQVVGQVVDYIGEHYGEDLSLEDLAERFYVSKYHLSHEFARIVGTSVHRYIMKKRLLIARQLMAQGVRPSQVWSEVGFGDYTGFYRAFKNEYGVTPREYAQSVKLQPSA